MDSLWDVNDVSEFLKVPVGTIRQWCSKQAIPHFKLGGHVRFRREDLLKWIQEKSVGIEDGDAIQESKQ